MSEESKPKPAGKKIKASQLSFNLPKEIQGEFEHYLEQAKKLEEEANQKLQESQEKENVLEETRKNLEAEKIEIRERLQAELKAIQKKAETEKNILTTQNDQLSEELKIMLERCDELRDQKLKIIDDFQKDKTLFEEESLKRGKEFKESISFLSQMLKNLTIEEKESANRKEKSITKLKQTENKFKKIYEEQSQNLKKFQTGIKALQIDRKKQKARLEKGYGDRTSLLEQEFKDKSSYFLRRRKELDVDEDLIEKMRSDLKIKERSLNTEVQKRADNRLKKKLEEIEKREKNITDREVRLIKQEESVKQQRQKMMKIIETPKGAKYSVAQLVDYADEEGLILKRKKEYLKNFKDIRIQMDKEFKARTAINEQEKEKLISQLDGERKKILDYKEDLEKKEKELFKRETKEIARLTEDYDDFKTSLEITQMENESVLDYKKREIQESEKKLLIKEEEIVKKEKASIESYMELEKQVIVEIQEVQTVRSKSQDQHEELAKSFLRNHTTYQQRLEFQNNEYKKFQKKLETTLKEAQDMNVFLSETGKSFRKNVDDSERAREERMEEKDKLLQSMQQELKEKLDQYQIFVEEMQGTKKDLLNKDRTRNAEFMNHLSHFENKLSDLGESYEDLSETFNIEKESGVIEIVSEDDGSPKYKTRIAKDSDIAKLEWPLAVKYKLDSDAMEVDESMLVDYLDAASGKYEEWISIPPGECLSAVNSSRSSGETQKIEIKKPLMISKFPVTNALFYRFALDTNYKTEAELTVRGIVYQNGVKTDKDSKGKIIRQSYSNPSMNPVQTANWFRPDGSPEALFDKYNHPVTQVTFSDAIKFCEWKTEMLGKKVRLPTEAEWEYIATNLGEISPENFHEDDLIKNYINFEGAGIGGTTPVDYFQEQDSTLGVHDLFGNVYEWVSNAMSQGLMRRSKVEYKVVKGGSFMTHLDEIAPWSRLSFAKNYSSSFLGFRLVCESE